MSAAAFALPPYAYAEEMLERGLANTDERIAADKPVTPTFLFAVLLWSAVLRELNERQAGPAPDIALLMQACDTVLRAQQSRVAIPRRFGIPMRELLMLQPRFNRRSGVKSLSLLQHPRFRAAYDFLLAARAGRRGGSGAGEVVDRYSSAAAGGAGGAGAGAARRNRPPKGAPAPGPAAPPPATRRSGAQLAMSSLWRPAYVAIGSNLRITSRAGAGGMRAPEAALRSADRCCARACI